MGDIMGAFNVATGLAEDPAQVQKDAAANSLAMQEKIYNQQRADFAPYQGLGEAGASQYKDYMAGKFVPQNSPAYQWQKDQLDKSMNRQLAARGRSNSTYGMQSMANAYGNLASTEYQNAYNRMLDPIKIGQGAAASAGSYGNNMSAAYGQYANSVGNAAQQGYANRQNLLYGNAGLGMSVYGMGKQQGWWGNGSNSGTPYESFSAQDGSGWDTTSGPYGDASYSGDGQLWD